MTQESASTHFPFDLSLHITPPHLLPFQEMRLIRHSKPKMLCCGMTWVGTDNASGDKPGWWYFYNDGAAKVHEGDVVAAHGKVRQHSDSDGLAWLEESLEDVENISDNQLLLELVIADLEELKETCECQDSDPLRRSLALLKHVSALLDNRALELQVRLSRILKSLEGGEE